MAAQIQKENKKTKISREIFFFVVSLLCGLLSPLLGHRVFIYTKKNRPRRQTRRQRNTRTAGENQREKENLQTFGRRENAHFLVAKCPFSPHF